MMNCKEKFIIIIGLFSFFFLLKYRGYIYKKYLLSDNNEKIQNETSDLEKQNQKVIKNKIINVKVSMKLRKQLENLTKSEEEANKQETILLNRLISLQKKIKKLNEKLEAIRNDNTKTKNVNETEYLDDNQNFIKSVQPVSKKENLNSTIGAQVLFLPCFVDGMFSNLRQFVGAIYLAREYNLVYIEQEFFYKLQDDGIVTQIAKKPMRIFDYFDMEYMSKFLRADTQSNFWGDNKHPKKSSVIESMRLFGVEYSLRCEHPLSNFYFNKGFQQQLTLYGLNYIKTTFQKNKFKSKPSQQKQLQKIALEPNNTRYIVAGTPQLPHMFKDYMYAPSFLNRTSMPQFWLKSFETLRFSKNIRNLHKKAKQLLKISDADSYISMHIRRGNTDATPGKFGQAQDFQTIEAVKRALTCINKKHGTKKDVKIVYISSVGHYLQIEVKKLQKFFPKLRIVGMGAGTNMPSWNELLPGLAHEDNTILRTFIEMQFWYDADAFCGTRSTMSGFMSLMRVAHTKNNEDSCNRFIQKGWLEHRVKFTIP